MALWQQFRDASPASRRLTSTPPTSKMAKVVPLRHTSTFPSKTFKTQIPVVFNFLVAVKWLFLVKKPELIG
jgi:hypothetical protein